jgi:hypothetical protein
MNEEGTDLPTEIADRRPRWMQSLSTTPLRAFHPGNLDTFCIAL